MRQTVRFAEGLTQLCGTSHCVLLEVGPSRPIGYSRARQHAAAPATFYREVLPILQQHCQVCHRNGGIAPMPFESSRQTELFASAISKASEGKTMPPWFADPSVGHFSNDPSLSAAEIVALVRACGESARAGRGDRILAKVASLVKAHEDYRARRVGNERKSSQGLILGTKRSSPGTIHRTH